MAEKKFVIFNKNRIILRFREPFCYKTTFILLKYLGKIFAFCVKKWYYSIKTILRFAGRVYFMRENEFEGSDILKSDFGELVTQLRKKYNLTQEMLSEISGISEVYLRRIERGNCTVTWVIWLTLCTALNVDIEEIQKKYILPKIKERVSNLGIESEYITE